MRCLFVLSLGFLGACTYVPPHQTSSVVTSDHTTIPVQTDSDSYVVRGYTLLEDAHHQWTYHATVKPHAPMNGPGNIVCKFLNGTTVIGKTGTSWLEAPGLRFFDVFLTFQSSQTPASGKCNITGTADSN